MPGDFLGILGPNGSGKTTLIEMFISMRWPDSGTLTLFGEDNKSMDREYLNRISYLSHDIQLNGEQSVQEFLDFHSFFYGKYSKVIEKDLLKFFEIDPNKKVREHSTGQQKKIQIIASLSSLTEIIIIDEVTAVLDPETRNKFFEKLKEHNQKYKATIIMATNVVEDLKSCTNKILFLKKGKSHMATPLEIDILFGGKNG